MDTEPQTSPLSHYIAVFRRRLWIIAACTLLVPAAALGFSLLQDKEYEATSSVLVSRGSLATQITGITPSESATTAADFDQILATQARLARFDDVARSALDASGLEDRPVSQLIDNSDVSVTEETDLLTFKVRDPNSRVAQDLATAYAEQFADYRGQLDTRSVDVALNDVRQEIRSAEEDDRSPGYVSSLASKEEELSTLRALQTSNAVVVSRPDSASQVQPQTERNVAYGLILGLLLGIGIALLRETLDTRVRTTGEIAEGLGLPLLARIDKPHSQVDGVARLAMLEEPNGVQAEGFRILRTNLDFVELDRRAEVIMVSSAVQGEGKTTTIANLAVAMARGGQRVALVDLDVRRPMVAQIFQIDAVHGLSSVVLGYAKLDDALVPIPLSDDSATPTEEQGSLTILPGGPPPPNPGEFVKLKGPGEVIGKLRERYDVVLVDAPPLLNVGDPMSLSPLVDAVFLVARLKLLRKPMLKEVRRVLDGIPVPVLGVVVTGADEEESRAYTYGYGYGYEYAVDASQNGDAPETAAAGSRTVRSAPDD